MKFKIALLKGDGIGPEVVDSTLSVLDRIARLYNHTFEYKSLIMGGIALDQTGVPLPEETIQGCLNSDSVLLGAVGGP